MRTQAPNPTAQGEILLAKYLTDSIRSIEHAIRKSAPVGATMGNLPRSLSAPRLDLRPDGRRPATEVLLPRKLPLSHAPAAAAALAATRRDDFGHTLGGPGRPGGQVVATQARLLHPGQPGYGSSPPPLPPRSSGGAPLPPRPAAAAAAAPPPPLPPKPAVVRTAHAIAAALHNQQQHAYGRSGGGAAGGRSTSAPRMDEQYPQQRQQQPHEQHHHHQNHSYNHVQMPYHGGQGHHAAQSEARIPAVSAAPPLAGLLGGGGGGGGGGAVPLRRSAPSDAGTHSSWWRWRPVTDASYPLTAVTDRYAQSLSPSEAVRWNDRVTRLEAEITAEKERRKQFEEQLKKLQVATSTTQVGSGAGPGGGGGGSGGGARSASKGGVPPFR
ncbi:hypothetical protein PLESTM_001325200 [Pleodorina starrii]|nr:hypothetical protein PLESTM_001325200 [Pleodorina starrii]